MEQNNEMMDSSEVDVTKTGDSISLGASIVLSGFKNIIKPVEFVVVKKIVGSYARKFLDNLPNYEGLQLHLKSVHRTEASEKFELHVKVMYDNKQANAEVTDRNLFVTLDSALKKIESQVF